MSRRLLVVVVGVLVLAGVGIGLALNYRSIILALVTAQGRVEVGPHQAVAWAQGPAAAPGGARPPNIVVILADDLGMNDVSTFGGGLVATPNIDALARSGATLTRAYAGTAACAPSRAMLLTGRYPTRHGFEFTPTPGAMGPMLAMFYNDGSRPHPLLHDRSRGKALPPMEAQGLPSSELTIAEVLRARGYHTAHIGKWHLGEGQAFGPNAQGFDESLLMSSGLYLPEDDPQVVNAKLSFDPIDRFLWARMQHAASFNGGADFAPRGYLTDYYTDEAVKVIRANRNRPFFLYLAHWGVHTPLQAAKADYDALSHIQDPRARVYAGMIRALDRSVGRVRAAIEEAGLTNDTIIVFTSDNGAAGYLGLPGVNRPYRGWKLTFFEGGIRVPSFVAWPGRIAPRSSLDEPVSHIDVLPTVAAAAGAALPSDRAIDGVDLMPRLTGAVSEPVRRPLYWQDGPYQAVLHDGWKLQVSHRPRKDWLFHLAKDPTEQRNLAALLPAKVAELKALIAAHRLGGRGPLYPYAGEMPVMIDKTLEAPANELDPYVYWPG